ncbi:MAG: hypothetical protein K8Q97_00245 [Candidatus Andersenbacteria bacterium]|nr:hypothetical protein [Candidatus Andersenbacteria bacterium]
MKIRYWLFGSLSVLYWGVVVWAAVVYSFISHDVIFLNIQAAQLPRLSHLVFAQFTATQTLRWDTPTSITRIEIPLYVPSNSEQILIKLYQNKQLVTWWKYQAPSSDSGVVLAQLPFIVPTTLSGHIEVMLDGSSIPYTESGRAPAFFAEPQNSVYPNGNYRIASNEKDGDMAMSIIIQKTNLQLYIENFQRQPLGSLSLLFIYGCAALLIFYVPILSMRIGAGLVSKRKT